MSSVTDAPGWRVEEFHGWVTVAHGEHESSRWLPQRQFVFDVAEFTRWYIGTSQGDLRGAAPLPSCTAESKPSRRRKSFCAAKKTISALGYSQDKLGNDATGPFTGLPVGFEPECNTL